MVLCLTVFSQLSARTWYVEPGGTGDALTIQAGIDSASVGDTVLVAAGTYKGPGNRDLDFGGTDLVLLSEAGADSTIIDCMGKSRGFYFHSGETGAAKVEGFTIMNGQILHPTIGNGGGMFCDGASPTISNCNFLQNCAGWDGGGMACKNASPIVSHCTFSQNSVYYDDSGRGGGGMSCWLGASPTVSNCIFLENSVGCRGGGMYCLGEGCSPTVDRCTFSGNSAAGGGGGGIYCTEGASPVVSNSDFTQNTAAVGGGIYYSDASPTLSGCTFFENTAVYEYDEGEGGGIFLRAASATVSSCTFAGNVAGSAGDGLCCRACSPNLNGCSFSQHSDIAVWCMDSSSPTVSTCTFAANGRGIACLYSSATVSNCTFLGNSGRGIWLYDSHVSVENTIIAYSPSGEAVWCMGSSTATLTCCDIYGNAGGDWVGCIGDQLGVNGNISACPSLCYANGGDFRLCDGSPCAPGNHPEGYACGLIGAWPVGCSCGPTVTESTTWGAIKATYR
jgi:predicted outer membrane repeat protein/parallel beta-helix repeat protein